MAAQVAIRRKMNDRLLAINTEAKSCEAEIRSPTNQHDISLRPTSTGGRFKK